MSECKFAVEAFHAYIESIGLSRPAGTLGEIKAFKAGAEWQRSQQSAPASYRVVPVELLEYAAALLEQHYKGNVSKEIRNLLAAAPAQPQNREEPTNDA